MIVPNILSLHEFLWRQNNGEETNRGHFCGQKRLHSLPPLWTRKKVIFKFSFCKRYQICDMKSTLRKNFTTSTLHRQAPFRAFDLIPPTMKFGSAPLATNILTISKCPKRDKMSRKQNYGPERYFTSNVFSTNRKRRPNRVETSDDRFLQDLHNDSSLIQNSNPFPEPS